MLIQQRPDRLVQWVRYDANGNVLYRVVPGPGGLSQYQWPDGTVLSLFESSVGG